MKKSFSKNMFLYTGFDGHEMHLNIIAIFDHKATIQNSNKRDKIRISRIKRIL